MKKRLIDSLPLAAMLTALVALLVLCAPLNAQTVAAAPTAPVVTAQAWSATPIADENYITAIPLGTRIRYGADSGCAAGAVGWIGLTITASTPLPLFIAPVAPFTGDPCPGGAKTVQIAPGTAAIPYSFQVAEGSPVISKTVPALAPAPSLTSLNTSPGMAFRFHLTNIVLLGPNPGAVVKIIPGAGSPVGNSGAPFSCGAVVISADGTADTSCIVIQGLSP